MNICYKVYKRKKGIVVTYVLVFGTAFLILISGLLGFISLQIRQTSQKVAWNEALDIAEAGINYYRWCINNEVEQNCLTEKDYLDPAGNLIGKFSLQATSTVSCSENIRREIVSTGWTKNSPQIKRKVRVLYARTSVGKYSYVLDANVWIGADHEIRGPYHSNWGIRMDGENQSTVTSEQSEWMCGCDFGCGYLDYWGNCKTDSAHCPLAAGCTIKADQKCWCPGVFTTTQNSNPDLFSFPVTHFNFVGITIGLAKMKEVAQTGGGVYLFPSTTTNPLAKGYHIKFKDNGTFETRIITQLDRTHCAYPDRNCAYSLEEGWHDDYFIITNEYLYSTSTIPSSCSVIFVEDNLWLEGVVKGKVSIASANLITSGLDTDVVLLGDLEYAETDGSDGLVLTGERNVLIGPQSPNNMTLRGIFIAQNGRFSRNHYPGNFRNNLEIYGSVVSKGRVGTQWTSEGHIVSGYSKRESYFDPNLIYNPPSPVPYISPDFKIVNWQEE